MIDILEHLQSEYVPKPGNNKKDGEVTAVIKSVFFGGNQVTQEQGRNAKDNRGDGDPSYHRCEGVETKPEDWNEEIG